MWRRLGARRYLGAGVGLLMGASFGWWALSEVHQSLLSAVVGAIAWGRAGYSVASTPRERARAVVIAGVVGSALAVVIAWRVGWPWPRNLFSLLAGGMLGAMAGADLPHLQQLWPHVRATWRWGLGGMAVGALAGLIPPTRGPLVWSAFVWSAVGGAAVGWAVIWLVAAGFHKDATAQPRTAPPPESGPRR